MTVETYVDGYPSLSYIISSLSLIRTWNVLGKFHCLAVTENFINLGSFIF